MLLAMEHSRTFVCNKMTLKRSYESLKKEQSNLSGKVVGSAESEHCVIPMQMWKPGVISEHCG